MTGEPVVVIPPAHATVDQLTDHLDGTTTVDPLPDDAAVRERLLEEASRVVDLACTVGYALDHDGHAEDRLLAGALAHAVCCQVEYWLEAGVDTDITGPLAGMSIGGLQIQHGAGPNRATPLHIAPRAIRTLRLAGLAGQPRSQ